MSWKQRPLPGIAQTITEKPIQGVSDSEPSIACSKCHYQSTITVLTLNQFVCPNCDAHLNFKARARIEGILDHIEGYIGEDVRSSDPLTFSDSKPYPARLATAMQQTGESEALLAAHGLMQDLPVVVAAFEFEFLGGSMGSVVGERFIAACHHAIAMGHPLICFASSGGARMQEGLLSLMQMARTAAAIAKLKQAHLPYVVVHVNPCYGGVSASLAMLGDIHIAEPLAMIGFAGRRVIENTVRQTLSDDFQTAEYLKDHGIIDQIVHRHDLKSTLYRQLSKLMHHPAP